MTKHLLNSGVSADLSGIGLNQIITMFDLLPDTLFWIKDTNSCLVHVNKVFLDTFGFKSLSQVVGKTDAAFSPGHLAHQYITDDQKVMAGELVTDRIELNLLKTGGVAWYSTSKRPLYDKSGVIVGSYGFTQHLEKTSHLLSSIDVIKGPVEYMREHFNRELTIEEVAQSAFLSVSALERRFKKHLAKTPKQFLNQIRLENARKMLLEENEPIIEVALKCGFTEHSYFSKQFKAFFGVQPSKLRNLVIQDI